MRPCVDLMYLCVPMRLRSEGAVSWMCVCSDTPRFRAGVCYVGTPLLQRLCIRKLCYLRCSDALLSGCAFAPRRLCFVQEALPGMKLRGAFAPMWLCRSGGHWMRSSPNASLPLAGCLNPRTVCTSGCLRVIAGLREPGVKPASVACI